MIDVKHLKTESKQDILLELTNILHQFVDRLDPASFDKHDDVCLGYILGGLVNGLELAGQEDYFGTEGWERYFGMED